VIIWFGGGLGNQMFQYALYLNMKKKGLNVKGDLSYYNNHKCHNGLEIQKIFNLEIENIPRYKQVLYRYLISPKIYKLGLFFLNSIIDNNVLIEKYHDRFYDFDKSSIKYAKGFWQSEKYFQSTFKDILSSYKFPELCGRNKSIAELIIATQSISIHIRRGDYHSSKNINRYMILSETEYYRKAIEYAESQIKDLTYFVFSDDIEWCKTNLCLENKIYFIDWNKMEDSFIDMNLMSQCKHNIIANSSFSWWAAWLNRNNNKIVIAPSKWYKDDNDGSIIIPDSWIKIAV